MNKIHTIDRVFFEGDNLCLNVDGGSYRLKLADISQRLSSATPAERERLELSPSGYGIHWPLLDEDLSIDGLLGITHAPAAFKHKLAI